ncbi:MAG TPA: type VI secretion system baseplate subunit TssK, partial [Pseudomonadales bacterium]|nr:type VI secretion system baseplate subunit TssK [Pseudomonadales bacterium]
MHTQKVVWLEGMFLRPQHFQQHDRFLLNHAEMLLQQSQPYSWGLSEFKIDRQLLLQGKLAFTSLKGIFPDGTPFSAPAHDPLPAVIELPTQARNQLIYLAVPLQRLGVPEACLPESESQARYAINTYAAPDTLAKNFTTTPIQTAALNLSVLCGEQDMAGYSCIPICFLLENSEEQGARLDDQFMPPCLTFQVAEPLRAFVTELSGLLQHRGEALAARILNGRLGGSAEIADYLMLQAVNRYQPVLANLDQTRTLHPFQLHTLLLSLAGELATFSAKTKRPPSFSAYVHGELNKSFADIIGSLRQSLSSVIEQNAIPLQWVERKFGIRVAPINDRQLIDACSFVLAAKAELSPEKLRGLFAAQAKIGPVEQISQLVNLQLPGITLL